MNKAINTCLAYEVADRKRGYATGGTRVRAFNCVNEELRSMDVTAPYSQITRGIESGMKAKGIVDDSVSTKAQRRRARGGRPHLNGSRKRR